MNLTTQEIKEAIKRRKIAPYEMELIYNLRNIDCNGIPLSIVVLCFSICNTNCYPTSIHLTRGMSYFKLVHGNINIQPKNLEYPNHSWVEKDGYVYDPTDGYKWEKSLYYRIFEPEVVEIYDENSVNDYDFYQEVINSSSKKDITKDNLTLILQYLEILEEENPTVNHTLLLDEIEICRQQYHITQKNDDYVMKKYRKLIEESLNKKNVK